MTPVPRIWRWAVRLLPRSFRERHAEAMTVVLREHLEGKDWWGRLDVHTRALADLLWTSAEQRARTVWTGREAMGSAGGRGTPRRRGMGFQNGKESGMWMHGWFRDLGYAARTLARRPGFTMVAVITMALGTGVTTAVGSLLYTVVLAPSPYEAPDEIVQIALEGEGRRTVMLPTCVAGALRETSADFLTPGFARFQDVALTPNDFGAPERVRGTIVTGTTLPMLGVDPLLGGLPDVSDDVPGGPCVTVLSHEIWSRRFGGAPDVVGDITRLDGEPCVVRAVMPEGFAFPAPYYAPGDLWLLAGPSGVDWDATDGWFLAFGRLGEGTEPAVAQERLAAIDVGQGVHRLTAMRWAEPISP